MTRTGRINVSSDPNQDPVDQCDTKRKLISLTEVYALPSALLVLSAVPFVLLRLDPFCVIALPQALTLY